MQSAFGCNEWLDFDRLLVIAAGGESARVEPAEVSVIRLQRLFCERRYKEALHLSKHAGSAYYLCKALIKTGSFAELENVSRHALLTTFACEFWVHLTECLWLQHVTTTCANSTSNSIESLAKFAAVPRDQPDQQIKFAMQQYLLCALTDNRPSVHSPCTAYYRSHFAA